MGMSREDFLTKNEKKKPSGRKVIRSAGDPVATKGETTTGIEIS